MIPPGVKVRVGDRNEYDPKLRTITLRPDASLYVRSHEVAHARQHHERSLIWMVYELLRWVPVLWWPALLLLEVDALLRVRRQWSRSLWRQHAAEAWAGWRSYLKLY